jgi:protoporphyrinogen oxidase
MKKKAIIIGAGPAGLTAAYELLKRTNIIPVILEKSGDIGGISKTVNYKGNRMDIGGHRFFSKSKRVMDWWLNIMPIENVGHETINISYQNRNTEISHSNKDQHGDLIMLVRNRLSRIYFLRKFFTYPIQLSIDTLKKLGLIRTLAIILSYLWARIKPVKPEKSLEDFFQNRFGDKLYRLFFKDYTEKVWGVECRSISAEWGAQRIKGISIAKAIQHALKTISKDKRKSNTDIQQKDTETSLIERFLYPKLGPGQLWEEVARQIVEMGGAILMNRSVTEIEFNDLNDF